MADRRRPLPPWVEGLRRAGLLEEPILVLGHAALARELARQGLRVESRLPRRSAPPTFATIIDLGWSSGRPPGRRRAALRDLADLALHAGVLHVHVPREARSLQVPGRPWQLLTVHDLDGAWVATFVRMAADRRLAREQAVRHFTDLGSFGSLDLGASTDRPYGRDAPGT